MRAGRMVIAVLAALLVVPPLVATGWIGAGYLFGRAAGDAAEPGITRVAIGSVTLSLLAAVILDITALIVGAPGQVQLGTWLESGDLSVGLSLTLDPLGLVMATLVAAICLATLRFSSPYMHREAGFRRFFLVLSLFTGGMLLIATAGNAVLTFVGWEFAGVSSYLLIGYAYDRPQATENALRAFLTNRIGDAGFVLAIFLAYSWLGSVEWPALAEASDSQELKASVMLLGFLLAAMAKSAQLPFSAWVSRALEGPTPSSAVFYGSVMIHAGVYLLIRLGPLMEQAPALMALVALLGLATALYGSLVGLTRADVKSGLMASVTAQVGLMFFWCGLGWFELATWHLVLHALWRAYQFLHAPALMHLMQDSARPVASWLGRRRGLYTAALQGFWLDPAADLLAVRPTRQLARDVQVFDDEVVDRLVGLPSQANAVSSLADWEERKAGRGVSDASAGRGLLGASIERLASMLHWFEEHLVLAGAGEGLQRAIQLIGGYLQQIEDLLSRPRYLMLLIMATLVVIL